MLGDNVRKLRKSLKITQKDLANAIGISQSTIGMIEKNRQGASNDTLLKLAKALNTTVDYLISDNTESLKTLGDKIIKLRKDRKLSQQELADNLKLSRSSIGMIESNKQGASSEKLKEIADFFGVTVDYLLSSDEDAPDDSPIELNNKDKKDIAKDLDMLMSKLDNKEDGPLFYDGDELNDENRELFKDALEFALKTIKIKNKEKYNPNKNKK